MLDVGGGMEIYRKLKNSSKLKILAFWKKKTLLIIPKAELLGREGIQNLSASYLLPEISGLVFFFFFGGGAEFYCGIVVLANSDQRRLVSVPCDE